MMQSDEEAAHWFRRAGTGKMAEAQVALAECYESGIISILYISFPPYYE
jgi:TPR repeat protein